MGCCNNFGFGHDRYFGKYDPYGYRYGRRRYHHRYDRRRGYYWNGYHNCPGRRCGFNDFNRLY